MEKLLFIISLFALPFISFSQAHLMLNNNVYINIEDDTYLVIDNHNTNAISTIGTGGNILSESETSVIKWNIGNTTGNYTIPFTNTDAIKIPLEINIATSGSTDGSFILSTYRTSNMNNPWPSDVTNMNSSFLSGNDASLFAIDRFWRIDGNSYSTHPSATLNFGYDHTNEAAAPNTIDELSLQAQRFNSNTNNWELLMFGSANTTTKKVNGVIVSPSDFYKSWTLVDRSTPLPVTLLYFSAECENRKTTLNWSTASENNNDYFVLEKSTDGYNFITLATIDGAGNSSTTTNYSYTDNTPNSTINYYRLKQVDFNGVHTYFDIISSNCSSEDDFTVNLIKFNDHSLQFNISTTTKEELTASLYDNNGRLIASQLIHVDKGDNPITLNDLYLTTGIYMLNIVGSNNYYVAKVFRR